MKMTKTELENLLKEVEIVDEIKDTWLYVPREKPQKGILFYKRCCPSCGDSLSTVDKKPVRWATYCGYCGEQRIFWNEDRPIDQLKRETERIKNDWHNLWNNL